MESKSNCSVVHVTMENNQSGHLGVLMENGLFSRVSVCKVLPQFIFFFNFLTVLQCSYLGSLCACTPVEHFALWMPMLSALVQAHHHGDLRTLVWRGAFTLVPQV